MKQEWMEGYMNNLKLEGKSPRTIDAYRIDLQQFATFLEEAFPTLTLPAIGVLHIRAFLRWLSEQPDCNRTLARKSAALNSWFKYLKKNGVIKDNPMRRIRRPKYEKKLPKVFSEEEMQVLLRIPDTSTIFGLRNRAILEMLYSCGLRLMELANLQLSDIDFRRKIIKVTGKGNKERFIPIGSFAIDSLQEYLDKRALLMNSKSGNSVFLTRSGKPFDSRQLNIILMRYIDLIAREKGYSPHTIRHSFATHLLSRGADLNAIKELMGHSDLSATEIYTHVSLADIKDAYEKGHPRSGE